MIAARQFEDEKAPPMQFQKNARIKININGDMILTWEEELIWQYNNQKKKAKLFSITICSLLCVALATHAEVVDITRAPFSAVGDGVADNRTALTKALASLKTGDTLFIPAGDYRIVLTEGQIKFPAGVTLLGQNNKTKLLLFSGEHDKHRVFLRLASEVTVEGLTVERVADFPIVIFPVFGDLRNIEIRNCTIVGNKTRFPGKYCHAFQVGVGKVKGFLLSGIEIRNCDYGLFQANNATGSLESVTVEHSRFRRNIASDLEFNSPKGNMRNIIVRQCFFQDNLCKSPSAGFAVGFANVKNGKVENCCIQNYGSEALHVEDRSTNILLSQNMITGGSLIQPNGVIMVLSNSKEVNIEGNFIDARPNTNRTHLILVTAGGENFSNPSGVSVNKNTLVNGISTKTWYLQPDSGPSPFGNVIMEFEDTQTNNGQ